jgi:hypothetical protein
MCWYSILAINHSGDVGKELALTLALKISHKVREK